MELETGESQYMAKLLRYEIVFFYNALLFSEVFLKLFQCTFYIQKKTINSIAPSLTTIEKRYKCQFYGFKKGSNFLFTSIYLLCI